MNLFSAITLNTTPLNELPQTEEGEEVLRAPENEGEIRIIEALASDQAECDLQWCDMSTPQAVSFACDCMRFRIGGMAAFTSVVLGGCDLGDINAPKIVRTLMSTYRLSGGSLESLDLLFNQLTKDGVHEVVKILREWGEGGPSFLGLSWNDIGDEGVTELLPLFSPVSTSNVTSLSLASCLITQKGALTIHKGLSDSNRIESLILKGNDIQPNTIAAIQATIAPPIMYTCVDPE